MLSLALETNWGGGGGGGGEGGGGEEYVHVKWDSVQQNHPSGQFFKFLNFLIFCELQKASIK